MPSSVSMEQKLIAELCVCNMCWKYLAWQHLSMVTLRTQPELEWPHENLDPHKERDQR